MASVVAVSSLFVPAVGAQSSPHISRGITSSQSRMDSRAPEGGAKFVVFGDSHTAGTNAPIVSDERGCLRGMTSWPAQLQRKLGVPDHEFIDSSCWGAGINTGRSFHLSDEARNAVSRGAFGSRTEHVLIQMGLNDQWGTPAMLRDAVRHCLFDLNNGCGEKAVQAGTVQNPHVITGSNYADKIRPVIDYIRYYAPNAKITLVGYPEMIPAGTHELCLSVGGLPVRKTDAWAVAQSINNVDGAQREAAQLLNLGFVDVKSATAGHHSCSAQPWINGFVDFRTSPLGGPLHPSEVGDQVTSDLVRAYVAGA